MRKICLPGVEVCDNGVDDDNNGVTDCEDGKCQSFAACAQCGDGFISSGEQCDDGGATGGDGCSADCLLEGSDEVEPNDGCLQAGGPLGVPSAVRGTSPPGDQDVFAINVPARADLRIRLHSQNSCEVYLSWSGSNCNSSLYSTCDQLDGTLHSKMRGVPPGIHYLRVQSNFINMDPVPYTVEVAYDALCGNGEVEGSEQCDGGPECTPLCTLPTTCGDGLTEGNEQCDDGNTVNGDSCSSSCLFLPLPEQEPNDTCAQSSGPFSPDIMVSGSIAAPGEVDYFAFSLDKRADLRLETFGPDGPGTCGVDTVIVLSNGNACSQEIARNDDGVEGQSYSSCSLIEAGRYPNAHDLAPGFYFVQVYAYSSSATFNYNLAVSRNTCGDGRKAGLEECDGGPDCTDECKLITVCGDGQREAGEQCDPPDVVTCGLTCATIRPPEIDCQDLFDNNSNGLTDCADPEDCQQLPLCTPGATPPGGPCTVPSDCQATGNDPLCFTVYEEGYCSEFCNVELNDCPAGSVCANYWGFANNAGSCMKACTLPEECGANQYCNGFYCAY